MTARVYIGGARDDASFDEAQAELLVEALTEAGVDFELVWYDALHGFAVPDNPPYDKRADEQHWEAMAGLFGATLDPAEPARHAIEDVLVDTPVRGRATRPARLNVLVVVDRPLAGV
jgi:hypothetical protein